jgi:hypothetical protein
MEVDMTKEEEEFDKMFHSTACEFDEDVEFAKVFNMTAFEFNENEGAKEFDKVFYTDMVEQDSGYQEVLCPLLRGGCSQDDFKTFTQKWILYAGCRDEIDERELRQELLNCAVGPLEDMMYDTLGAKVDSLSEADLLDELEKLATVKTGTKVQAGDYPAMITMKNPVQQPTHTHDQPALAMGNIAKMTTNPTFTELYYQYPVMISGENPIQLPTAHTHNQPALAERGTATITMDSTITKPCYQCGEMTHTDKTLADQCRLMTAIASRSMDSAATKLWYQCGEVTHADKMLADQCRLMTAILGEGWGKLSSKPMDMSKVAKKPMAKHDDDGNDDPDEDTSTEMTEETKEIHSKAWTASRPTKPNRNEAATELTLNSNITRGVQVL